MNTIQKYPGENNHGPKKSSGHLNAQLPGTATALENFAKDTRNSSSNRDLIH